MLHASLWCHLPMKLTSLFSILHWNLWIPRSKYNLHYIEVGLGTISHKSFKINVRVAMHFHDFQQRLPHLHLLILGFTFHIAYSYSDHLLELRIINMNTHCGPSLHFLYVIIHHPLILKISPELHPPNNVHPTCNLAC